MILPGRNRQLLLTVALSVLLLGAHFAAALHDFEHDPDALDGKVCAACLAATQLGSATIDSHDAAMIKPAGAVVDSTCTATFYTTHVAAVRQRGPPALA